MLVKVKQVGAEGASVGLPAVQPCPFCGRVSLVSVWLSHAVGGQGGGLVCLCL